MGCLSGRRRRAVDLPKVTQTSIVTTGHVSSAVSPGIALGRRGPYLCAGKTPNADATGNRTMQSIYEILRLILGIAKFFIFAHFIMSWLISFQVLNVNQPMVAQIWYGLGRILEPIYAPIRRVLPPMSGLDLAPLVALIGIYILEILLRNNAAMFGF